MFNRLIYTVFITAVCILSLRAVNTWEQNRRVKMLEEDLMYQVAPRIIQFLENEVVFPGSILLTSRTQRYVEATNSSTWIHGHVLEVDTKNLNSRKAVGRLTIKPKFGGTSAGVNWIDIDLEFDNVANAGFRSSQLKSLLAKADSETTSQSVWKGLFLQTAMTALGKVRVTISGEWPSQLMPLTTESTDIQNWMDTPESLNAYKAAQLASYSLPGSQVGYYQRPGGDSCYVVLADGRCIWVRSGIAENGMWRAHFEDYSGTIKTATQVAKVNLAKFRPLGIEVEELGSDGNFSFLLPSDLDMEKAWAIVEPSRVNGGYRAIVSDAKVAR